MSPCDQHAYTGNPKHVPIRELWQLAAVYHWAVQRYRLLRTQVEKAENELRRVSSPFEQDALQHFLYEMELIRKRLSGVISWAKAVANARFDGKMLNHCQVIPADIELAKQKLAQDPGWYKGFDFPAVPQQHRQNEDFDAVDYVLRYRLPYWFDSVGDDLREYFRISADPSEQCPTEQDLYRLFLMALRYFFISAHKAGASIEFKYPHYALLTQFAMDENLIHDRRYYADESILRLAAHLIYDNDEELFRDFTQAGLFPFEQMATDLLEESL